MKLVILVLIFFKTSWNNSIAFRSTARRGNNQDSICIWLGGWLAMTTPTECRQVIEQQVCAIVMEFVHRVVSSVV